MSILLSPEVLVGMRDRLYFKVLTISLEIL